MVNFNEIDQKMHILWPFFQVYTSTADPVQSWLRELPCPAHAFQVQAWGEQLWHLTTLEHLEQTQGRLEGCPPAAKAVPVRWDPAIEWWSFGDAEDRWDPAKDKWLLKDAEDSVHSRAGWEPDWEAPLRRGTEDDTHGQTGWDPDVVAPALTPRWGARPGYVTTRRDDCTEGSVLVGGKPAPCATALEPSWKSWRCMLSRPHGCIPGGITFLSWKFGMPLSDVGEHSSWLPGLLLSLSIWRKKQIEIVSSCLPECSIWPFKKLEWLVELVLYFLYTMFLY